jgi:hypothetical protein
MTTMRGRLPGLLVLPVLLTLSARAFADDPRYEVRPVVAGGDERAPVEYQADNPANEFRFKFPATGLIGTPEQLGSGAWNFELRLTGITFDGRFAPPGPAKMSADENRVDYDLGNVRVSYINTPKGLEQLITILAPETPAKPGSPTVIGLELSVDGGLTPVRDGYFVKLVRATGEAPLRYGPVHAEGANEQLLDARLEPAPATANGSISGARVTINAIDPVYPITLRAELTAGTHRESEMGSLDAPALGEAVGVPVTLQPGITVTVAEIMERERLAPSLLGVVPRETHHEMELDWELKEDPNAPPPMSHWPPIENATTSSLLAPGEPNLPQTVGTSFKGVGISESGFIPPDSMGDVGPTQVLMEVNGRIKVFSKTGTVGGLNASDASFWSSVASGVSDPQVRYDRLSGRWFVLGITLESSNNKIVLAVSSGPTITSAASFTFYQFNIGTPAPADAGCFCDYPGFGIDANALYTGCNMFTCSFHTSAFVIRKSSVLSGGPIVVTGFPNIGNASFAGPYAPRGVDNDDPNATEGYIIGTDPGFLNRINIRRVLNPGGVPTLSPTITLNVANTNMVNQPASGSTTDLDASNVRLFAASIHKNKITGVSSLWTAHSVETNTSCTPASSGTSRRLGAKWYEIGNMTTSPTIIQFGTLCTTTLGSPATNSERGFLYPTVVASGQGHMALGASQASATEFVGIAAAGRLRTDPAAGTRAPETVVLAGSASYTLLDPNRNRWGDYSFTDVDPTDDQTIWTFQEYADTPANNWSVRAVQLKAPPPPTAATADSAVCLGYAAAPVNISGVDSCAAPTCTNGLCTGGGACPEFFDPGPDTGGPGYSKHLTASVTGGITVNSANIIIPASPTTQRVLGVALSLNTTATTTGTKTVTITNPDAQGRAYNNLINVVGNRFPVASPGGPYVVCSGGAAALDGTASSDADIVCGDSLVSYEWDLNGDAVIDATGATPTITPAQLTSLGLGVGPHTITLKVTDSHAATNTVSGTLTIVANGGSCTDGNACTQTDTCQSGTCVGANPVTCSASDQCHLVGVCDTGTGICSNPNKPNGTACVDGNACTQIDSCQSGVCFGSNPVNCSDGNTCTSDVCNTGTGACTNPNVTDGTPCSDGNACTQTDTCQTGVCSGANPVVCTASNQCHVAGVCDTGTGVCSNPNAANGTGCNDSNVCTQTDSCQSGICTGSNPIVCSASDQCHVAGVCNAGTGLCSNPTAPNGTACVDGNACTQTDTCQSGTCTGSNPVVCTASDSCHLAGTCDTGTGSCSNPAAPDGTSCNDQDATTCGDICTSAVCAGHAVAAPAEIDDTLRLDKTPTDTTITWSNPPGPYGVYRGTNGPEGSPWSYNQSCLVTGLVAPPWVDPEVPAPGVFFYYLISRFDECRQSALGEDGSLNPIPNTQPCPTP